MKLGRSFARTAILLVAGLALSISAFAQGTGPNLPVINRSYDGGVFYSPAYNYGGNPVVTGLKILNGNAATGSGQSITLQYGYVTLPDGRVINPFTGVATLPAITIADASAETFTPSSASCATPAVLGTCVLTGTISNIHGQGANVYSGDAGIQEAINDAAAFGGGMVFWVIDPGAVTLNTGGANTNLGTISIPTRSVVMSATARVTTTIGTCAGGWSLGWSTGTEFTAANTTLTAGTTTDSSTVTLPAVVGAATIPINKCTTSNASAGAIHARFSGYKLVAPGF